MVQIPIDKSHKVLMTRSCLCFIGPHTSEYIQYRTQGFSTLDFCSMTSCVCLPSRHRQHSSTCIFDPVICILLTMSIFSSLRTDSIFTWPSLRCHISRDAFDEVVLVIDTHNGFSGSIWEIGPSAIWALSAMQGVVRRMYNELCLWAKPAAWLFFDMWHLLLLKDTSEPIFARWDTDSKLPSSSRM